MQLLLSSGKEYRTDVGHLAAAIHQLLWFPHTSHQRWWCCTRSQFRPFRFHGRQVLFLCNVRNFIQNHSVIWTCESKSLSIRLWNGLSVHCLQFWEVAGVTAKLYLCKLFPLNNFDASVFNEYSIQKVVLLQMSSWHSTNLWLSVGHSYVMLTQQSYWGGVV